MWPIGPLLPAAHLLSEVGVVHLLPGGGVGLPALSGLHVLHPVGNSCRSTASPSGTGTHTLNFNLGN